MSIFDILLEEMKNYQDFTCLVVGEFKDVNDFMKQRKDDIGKNIIFHYLTPSPYDPNKINPVKTFYNDSIIGSNVYEGIDGSGQLSEENIEWINENISVDVVLTFYQDTENVLEINTKKIILVTDVEEDFEEDQVIKIYKKEENFIYSIQK